MMNRIKSNIYMLLTAVAVCFALGACSGEEGDSLPQVPANPDALCVITPHAIAISSVDASATPITRSAAGELQQKATYVENLGVNYSAEATLEATPQDARTRATGSLATGAQYRIVVYDGAGEIKGNVVYKQGSTAVVSGKEIKLKAGTYRLFCYTFNSTATIRELDADNRNVTVNSGEDFMTYTDASFNIVAADYGSGKLLNISFVRQCTRLTVTIKAEGYTDGTITAASLTVGNVFGGGNKWNGYTNTDAATLASTAGTASLTKASANALSVDCGSATDNPYLITSPCSNQTISVSGLSVTIQDLGTKLPANFSFPNPITLAKGGSYRLTITVGKYYVLTSTNPVTIGGVKWARTNLQQTGSGITAPVSFVANPWDYGSYWSWGTRAATVFGNYRSFDPNAEWNTYTSSGTNQNPCCTLGSGWRLPTEGELSSLVNNPAPNGIKVKINGTINTIGDYGWAPDAKGAVLKSGNQLVFLPAAGYANDSGVWGQGSETTYWSSTPNESVTYDFATCLIIRSDDHFIAVAFNYRTVHMTLRCIQDN